MPSAAALDAERAGVALNRTALQARPDLEGRAVWTVGGGDAWACRGKA